MTQPVPHAGKPAVLLINLGTPEAPTAPALRKYLKQFLWDPRVVELPRPLWWLVLNLIILNIRPKASAEKYAKVWTPEGSPLKVHTERQAKLLRGYLGQSGRDDIVIEWAMRYGEPSVAAALDRLKAAGCTRILVVPLYPQYSVSTTASAMDAVAEWVRRNPQSAAIETLEHFHDNPGYIAALTAGIRAHWMDYGRPEKLVMSFHGLPKVSIARGDPYYGQCFESGRLLASELGLTEDDYAITFQSRFGPAEWLQPYTQQTLEALGRSGVGRVDVVCPGFVSDCLETLEEIAMECREAFLAAGGREFRYIPCLNERHEWIKALADLAGSRLAG
ncbi:MAG: ferrochelatase [Bryobacteraceae bacterium]|jgi:ferrochelatase|nr:Ferrochelatase [Rhodocyclaceae bacterium]MBZ0145388.1 ferrochelatase [Rhodocyclaceae bacterium]MCC6879981.1 ferrochelatase [Rhodocyclaceae bacterium]MCL4679718.1 ferrochelatase [Rhodocyclaceae bacterium]NUN02117.1 ferrochelatase [Bryobacteraceae bacterium]